MFYLKKIRYKISKKTFNLKQNVNKVFNIQGWNNPRDIASNKFLLFLRVPLSLFPSVFPCSGRRASSSYNPEVIYYYLL